jgi:amino acid transporter
MSSNKSTEDPITLEYEIPKEIDDDALELAEVGYVQAYTRKYNLVTAIGFTVGASGTWEGIVGSIGSALSLGGPSSLLWGFVLGAIGMSFVACSLAELSSIYPTAGGQYHWASALSPKKYKVVIGWITAWSALTTAWIGVICSAASFAVQVQGYAVFANPDYEPKRWHVTLIYWLTLAIYLAINIYGVRKLQYLNYYVIGVHIVGYLAIIISTTATNKDFNSAVYAFSGFSNLSGWPDGLAWCVGILTASMGFIGIETAVHFAEEIKHASVNVPRAIFWPVLMNGIMTIPFLICICFIVPSEETIFSSRVADTAPSIMIWYESLKNVGGAIFLNALNSTVAFVGGVFSLGSAGRMTYAMSRDRAIPAYFGTVNEKWEVSIPSQISGTIFPFIIGLVYIWNSTALYGVMSGLTLSYQITYFIPIALTFAARRNGLMENRGKWRLGKWGYLINGIGFIYLLFTIIFLSFPTTYPTSAATMNYAVVLVGFGWFLSIVVWFLYGKKYYKGPTSEPDSHALEAVLSARSDIHINGLAPGKESYYNIISSVSNKRQEASES